MEDKNHPIYQLVRDILQVITFIVATYAGIASSKNGTGIEQVQQKQTEVVVKQDEAAEIAATVKAKLDAKAEEESRALGINLYSTMKYLEDVADLSGNVNDRAKAVEAKKAYDEHTKRLKPQPR